ncbi:MAG TPA: methylase [Archangium sp.]
MASRNIRHRTRPGRLSALDAWLVENERSLLDGRGALVDVGYGETPITTLELARTVRSVTPSLRVVGIERAENVEPELELLAGDFSTCASLGPTAVVRAMNVLRGYREDEVPAIHAALGAAVIDGGLVLEGSTDTEGHVTVCWLLRKKHGALVKEALLFHTDFSRGFSPWLFRDWLPRELRRSVKPGTQIHELLSAWDARIVGEDPRARFESSIGGAIQATAWERANGFVRTAW